MKKVLFLNPYRNDSRSLAYPFSWAGERFTHHAEIMKEKGKQHGIICDTLENIPFEEADLYVWQERYKHDSPLLMKSIESGKPCYLVAAEPPLVSSNNYADENIQMFSRIFTWRKDLIDNIKYFPIKPIYFNPPARIEQLNFRERNFITMIASIKTKKYYHEHSLYPEREKAINWFEENHPGEMDFYCFDAKFSEGHKSYKGAASEKVQTLMNYKFSICYENMFGCAGYLTEKIFDSMYAGCVPIYLGESSIEEYVPQDCFIDKRRYDTYKELYDFLSAMNENTWEQYRMRINKYINTSDFVRSYKPENYVNALLEYILVDLQ